MHTNKILGILMSALVFSWVSSAIRLNRQLSTFRRLSQSIKLSKGPDLGSSGFETGDLLMTGLNSAQDISVKVVSCRELVQEAILRNDLNAIAGQTLGEVMSCALMMGSGYKGEETLQVNIVGTKGLRNVMAITDGDLKMRGMVGTPRFNPGSMQQPRTRDLFGDEGQVQIVRNHPSWKNPQVGIVSLRDTSIGLNLALYMTESEQRSAVMITDVKVEGNLCRHALAICVERLPGCTDENIELSIRNLENVEKRGLRTYLERTAEERKNDVGEFRDFAPVLDKVLDDCFENMGCELRWTKAPQFRCSCGLDKVWRTLRLLPKSEIRAILDDPINNQKVEIACEFCGEKYSVSKEEIESTILAAN